MVPGKGAHARRAGLVRILCGGGSGGVRSGPSGAGRLLVNACLSTYTDEHENEISVPEGAN